MRILTLLGVFMLGLSSASSVNAASIYAGQARAAAVCSQCHGIKNPSADAPFPPLAGRDVAYLKSALEQYRDKTRKSDIMNAIAGSLTDNDISNVAAYYAGLKP
jgi:cytochrome c553